MHTYTYLTDFGCSILGKGMDTHKCNFHQNTHLKQSKTNLFNFFFLSSLTLGELSPLILVYLLSYPRYCNNIIYFVLHVFPPLLKKITGKQAVISKKRITCSGYFSLSEF